MADDSYNMHLPFFMWHKATSGVDLLGLYLVMSVQLFCCLSVLRALKRSGPGEGERGRGSDIKRRAFKIILLFLIIMLVMYFPFVMFSLLSNVLSLEQQSFTIS